MSSWPLMGWRELGRATLARQHLIHRSPMSPDALVSHLVGLQAQTAQTWYIGLWSRLAGFDPEQVSASLERRELVRISMMRSTLHLVTAADCLAFRRLFDPVNARGLQANLRAGLAGVDTVELAVLGRRLLSAGPLTFTELGDRLLQRWPDADRSALSQGVRALLPLVQVPPRGMWGRSGPAAHTTAAQWLGRPVRSAPSIDDLVLRYLEAFGPATVRDVQAWSGLTRLEPVLDRLRPALATFTDPAGRELFDRLDAPRPPGQTPVPARFLADFDNLLLAHADRSRFVTPQYLALGFPVNGQVPRAFLLDGFTAGTWSVTTAGGLWTLQVTAFGRLADSDRQALEVEGLALLAFLATGARTSRPPSFAVRFIA